jgi:hypothetical protein
MKIGVIALVVAVSLPACAYQRSVPAAQLARLREPGHGDAVVLRSRHLLRARLNAGSRIRFQRGDGAWTRWLGASNLMVDQRGVYVHGGIEVTEAADAVRLAGLDDGAVRALERTRPVGGVLDTDAGEPVMRATGEVLRGWIDAFITEVARLNDPRSPVALCGPDRDPAPGCDLGEYDVRARIRLHRRLGGKPLGAWSFHVPGRGWLPAVDGKDLRRTLDRLAIRIGWKWADMTGAQVESLSGMRSLPVALIAGPTLGPYAWLQDRTGSEKRVAPDDPIVDRAYQSPVLDAISLVPLRNFDGAASWAPTVADSAALDARPLFTGRAVRRAGVMAVIAADALATFPRPDRELEGITFAARFGELLEIGMGLRRLAGRGLEQPGRWSATALWSFYVGGHFFIDANQRLALPVGVEVGASGTGGFTRLRAGLRARVWGDWFAGVYPFNPTFMGVDVARADKHADDMPRWSFPSGVELGIAF